MKLRPLILAFTLLVFTNLAAYSQGFPWELYKPRTFTEIIKLNADVEERKYEQKQIALNADSLPSQVRVAYTGQSRPISSVRKELIKMWVGTFGVKPDISGLLETELLFIECNNEYWLPVQKQVIPHLERKLKAGEMVSIFIIRVGGEKSSDRWDWLFIVNEFQKY